MDYVGKDGRKVPYCTLCETCLFERGTKKHTKTNKHKNELISRFGDIWEDYLDHNTDLGKTIFRPATIEEAERQKPK